jgi:ribosome-binding factor A
VYFTAFGDDKAQAGTRAALRSATKHLRHELGRQIRLKVTPEIEFVEDDTTERGDRIDRIIAELHHGERP